VNKCPVVASIIPALLALITFVANPISGFDSSNSAFLVDAESPIAVNAVLPLKEEQLPS
jgi:hypothetical protein